MDQPGDHGAMTVGGELLPVEDRGGFLIQNRRGLLIEDNGGSAIEDRRGLDRKSTRLNSSHLGISYAVFCLKKKQNIIYSLVGPFRLVALVRADDRHLSL